MCIPDLGTAKKQPACSACCKLYSVSADPLPIGPAAIVQVSKQVHQDVIQKGGNTSQANQGARAVKAEAKKLVREVAFKQRNTGQRQPDNKCICHVWRFIMAHCKRLPTPVSHEAEKEEDASAASDQTMNNQT